jgi:hypothetical protein
MAGPTDNARRLALCARLGLSPGGDLQYAQGVEDAVEAVARWLSRPDSPDYGWHLTRERYASNLIRSELLLEED